MLNDLEKLPDEEQSTADNFAKTLMQNPDEIIKWAESEIREYKKLIEILKKAKK